MGKTDSIKDRRVDVYTDTLDRKERWAQHAEAAGESLSTFVQQCVEFALNHGGPDFVELGERGKKVQELEEEVDELRSELKQKDIVINKLESELRRHRMGPFLEEDFEGTRRYDQELIETLKRADQITGEELVRRLGAEQSDREVMKAIDSQLQQLEAYELVEHTPRGWRWVG